MDIVMQGQRESTREPIYKDETPPCRKPLAQLRQMRCPQHEHRASYMPPPKPSLGRFPSTTNALPTPLGREDMTKGPCMRGTSIPLYPSRSAEALVCIRN